MAEPSGRPPRAGLRPRALRALLTVFALLSLPSWATAQFVSACGSAPSGTNACPWYHVEIIIFRNDAGAGITAEGVEPDALPRWTERLATLRPVAGEPLRPTRTTELQALWQSADEAPQWFVLTPGLSFEQERFLTAISGIGEPRRRVDLGFLRELDALVWEDVEMPEPEAASDPGVPAPELEPMVASAPSEEEVEPALPDEFDAIPELVGIIPMELAFRELTPGERILEAEATRLRRARGYEVLAHLAWRQPFLPNEPGMAQLIATADPALPDQAAGELLLGTVTIDLRRFLHAHLDLYYRPRQPAALLDADTIGRNEASGRFIHIRQSRRMRSGELHYLDHPQIGAIIRIERFEPADDS